MDAAFVHQPQACLRVEGAFVHPVEAALQRIEEGEFRAVSRHDTPSAGESYLVAIYDPGCQTLALFHMQHAVLVAFRGSAGPKVVRLRVVSVCIDDLEIFSQLCHVTFLDPSNIHEPSDQQSRAVAPRRQPRREESTYGVV